MSMPVHYLLLANVKSKYVIKESFGVSWEVEKTEELRN